MIGKKRIAAISLACCMGTAQAAEAAIIMKDAEKSACVYRDGSFEYIHLKNVPYCRGTNKPYAEADDIDMLFGNGEERSVALSGGGVTVKNNGSSLTFPVGRSFRYRRGSFENEYIIYAFDGKTYFPLELLAKRLGIAEAATDDGYIICADNDSEVAELLDKNGEMSQKALWSMGYYAFQNSLSPTSYYLSEGGEPEKDTEGDAALRICRDVYYIKNGALFVHRAEEAEHISVKDSDGTEIYISSLIAVRDVLYGIAAADAKETAGRLFRCMPDGSGFEYLTEYDITNLIYMVNEIDGAEAPALFFLDTGGDRTMCMYDLRTDESFKMMIYDAQGNNIMRGAARAVISDRGIALVNSGGTSVTFVRLADAANRCEWIKIWDKDDIITAEGASEKKKFTRISAVNVDDTTGTVYFSDNTADGRSVIYMSRFPECSIKLVSSVNYEVKKLTLLQGKDKVLIAEGDKTDTQIKIK